MQIGEPHNRCGPPSGNGAHAVNFADGMQTVHPANKPVQRRPIRFVHDHAPTHTPGQTVLPEHQ